MSIGEKLTTIAENQPKVYEAGKEDARRAFINPEWTDWRHFSLDNSRNSLVPLLRRSDTSNGKDFSEMLRGCTDLTTVPDLDTSNGENFSGMYYANHALTTVPDLDTSNGKDFSYMHNCCCNMPRIPNYDLSKGEDFSYMYWNCQKAVCNHPISIPKAIRTKGMFRNSYALSQIILKDLDESILEDTEEMFNSCNGLISVGGIIATGKTGAAKMFRGCDKLQTINHFLINPNTPASATDVWKETFEWNYALEELGMKGKNKWSGLNLKYSTKLSRDSIISVVKALDDNTSGLTVTLSKTAVDNALPDDWAELAALRPNWTIKLA